ncbi:trans-sialidase, partial [Trypanosoma cruzi]
MLSRVAAVKAPRTHNRRRVTGSSGRRREGRESEPQRPNMSRHLFYSAMLLLLVVMMCCGTGGTHAEVQPSQSKFEWKGITDGVTEESLGVPGLLKVGNDVFAVAEAQCKKGEDTFTGVVSQLLTKETTNKPVEFMKGANTKTRFLVKGPSADAQQKVDVSRPTTVVKGNDIYMLAGKYSRTTVGICQESGADDSGLLLVKGDVTAEEGEKIHWNDAHPLPCTLLSQEHDSLMQLVGGGGSGVNINDDTLVFPVEATRKVKKQKETDTENDEKAVSLIIYTLKDTAESWTLSKGMSDDGCSDPSVVEWEKDKLIMMTACDDGRRRVYESGDKGESWTEALGTLSRVWGSKQKGEGAKGVRSGLITATIGDDKRNVMLVTLPVYSEKDGKKEKGELHLWLTDNTHIVDIGPVSEKDEDAAASSLLYKSAGSGDKNEQKEELIALYEKKGDGKPSSYGMVSVLLTEQLQRVKEVLAKWEKVDEIVSKLCASGSTEKSASPENACRIAMATKGLVGFLSGNFSGTTWRDEYLGVNATVKVNGGGATKTSDKGVTLQGAWAEW